MQPASSRLQEERKPPRDFTKHKIAWFVLLVAAAVLVIVAIGIPRWLHNTDTDGYLALSDGSIHTCWTLAFVFNIIGIGALWRVASWRIP